MKVLKGHNKREPIHPNSLNMDICNWIFSWITVK
jgi:hypothetical protein